MITRRQRTIAHSCTVSGIGYWSGKHVHVEFRPAAENEGIVFVRSDRSDNIRIAARLTNRVESNRRTTLERDGVRIDMVEHLLAALAGLQIDNCEVWVDAPEMPASDGSCWEATQVLLATGIVEQTACREVVKIVRPCRVGDSNHWIELSPLSPSASGVTEHVSYQLDYGPDSTIRRQEFGLALNPDVFAQQIAPARTFITEREANQFREQGFGKNLSFENILVFGPNGPIENELRFEDECARHKILDFVGDVSLLGCDLHARVVAHRSGHQLNAALVRQILNDYSQNPARVPA